MQNFFCITWSNFRFEFIKYLPTQYSLYSNIALILYNIILVG